MKKVRIIIIIVFIGFFVLISGASLIIKDREFSPNENRYLAETPELSWDNILSGKFQDGLEDYLRDQVCFRDGWITVKTGIQKACGDTDIGGAYVGKDGYDFEKITPEDVDEKQVDRNIKAVEDYFMMASETIDKQITISWMCGIRLWITMMNIFIIRQIIIGHRQGPVWHMMCGVNAQVEKLRRKMDL